jgi:hypothetical protein
VSLFPPLVLGLVLRIDEVKVDFEGLLPLIGGKEVMFS